MKKIMDKILGWLKKEVSDFFNNFSRDVKSLRSVLNWIYCLFYLWVVVYCITHNPSSMDTAIATTGGVVSIIFTSYVASKSYEKVRMKIDVPKKQVDEDSASD